MTATTKTKWLGVYFSGKVPAKQVQSTDFNPQHHQKQANKNQVSAKPGSNGGTEEQKHKLPKTRKDSVKKRNTEGWKYVQIIWVRIRSYCPEYVKNSHNKKTK